MALQSAPEFLIVQKFIKHLEDIYTEEFAEPIIKMTKMTILFEGFYQALPENSRIKSEFLVVRIQRWQQHYGVPSVTFLLSYKLQIEDISSKFQELNSSPIDLRLQKNSYSTADENNNVIINPNCVSEITVPEQKEETGKFLKTYNPFGGFTTAPCDPYSANFIKYAELVAEEGGRVLEIGAAFGVASLQALARGAEVFCNDISPESWGHSPTFTEKDIQF
ncbi:hypothetical protein EAW55_08575 [Legionella jordanis]|uniref:Putative Methyltransferase n=1 Tax=Legionella jordanis TaxID=456 RepID=A0A0W0VD41_9GAMM|nr:hypothetical protein [Legionella jordanis]KTD18008.1 putative Methyltransferase [Legionella jordanis]RMX02303.1 hypothetical protein EAW55_08575 [Legionella jordanis]RMX21212.1 hypothetical protein EAS68_03295 [Legionella jordanis]VEH13900.1 putative Methyltransferase [Legionella jordanis]